MVFFLFSHVEHVISETVRLFSVGSILSESNGERILPLHFVALLDTEANWFRTWMVGYSEFLMSNRIWFLKIIENYF
jgi:hypothetical protein